MQGNIDTYKSYGFFSYDSFKILYFPGSQLFLVSATGPQDVSDIVYSIVGASPAPTYFAIDNNGRITVQTELTQDNTNQYQVWFKS